MGDGGEQVDFLFPPAFAPCAPCRPRPRRAGPGHAPDPPWPRIQPRVRRVRPEPAVLPLLAEAPRRRRLLLPLLLLLPQLLLPLRRSRGHDLRVQRRVRQRPGQGGLELICVQALRDPVQRPRGRRDPRPVAGLTRQPWAANSSWSLTAAGPAITSGPRYPHAAPATSTRPPAPAHGRSHLLRRCVGVPAAPHSTGSTPCHRPVAADSLVAMMRPRRRPSR